MNRIDIVTGVHDITGSLHILCSNSSRYNRKLAMNPIKTAGYIVNNHVGYAGYIVNARYDLISSNSELMRLYRGARENIPQKVAR